MSIFNLRDAVRKAEQRLESSTKTRRRAVRSDLGRSRMNEAVQAVLAELLGGQQRLPNTEVQKRLVEHCRRIGAKVPARATVYQYMARMPTGTWRIGDLSVSVRQAVHNLTDDTLIPGHQLAFYCFNHGDLRAVSFAAGLPWLSLYQAARMRGWRPKSRGLLHAAMRFRGI